MASRAEAQIVEDGGLITVGSTTYRLWGLVVPDRDTPCIGDWNAGRAAAKHLEQLTRGRAVDCEYRGKDSDGTTLALCRADGRDIGADLVQAGYAWSNGPRTTNMSSTRDWRCRVSRASTPVAAACRRCYSTGRRCHQ